MSESTEIERVGSCGPASWLSALEEGDTSPAKLLAVAALGAIGSLALYYIYASLSAETRESIRDQVVGAVKSNLNRLTEA